MQVEDRGIRRNTLCEGAMVRLVPGPAGLLLPREKRQEAVHVPSGSAPCPSITNLTTMCWFMFFQHHILVLTTPQWLHPRDSSAFRAGENNLLTWSAFCYLHPA